MTGLIPRPFIDELLNRTDIVELIDGYVPLKKRGTSHIACCPFHTEKTPSFNVIAKKQFYHCFGCGASGNAIDFAINYLHLGFSDAIETLASRIGLNVPREGSQEKHLETKSLYQFLKEVSKVYQQILRSSGAEAIAYLKQRGVNGDIAQKYQLGFAPPGWRTLLPRFTKHTQELLDTGMLIKNEEGKTYDRYRNRIMFPIHDRQGRIVGFGGRALDNEQKPKYLNSPETAVFQKSRELYGLYQVIQQQASAPNILIVEGYMDVIALAQHGILNAVATLGTSTSTYHIQLLSKHTQQLIFCFDGDAAGRQAAWRALEHSLPHLNKGLDASFIFLPEGHDPDSLVRLEGRSRFLARLQEATPLHRFFFDSLLRDIDSNTLAGKSQLLIAAKPYLQKITDGPYQQLLVNELSRMTRIEHHRIQQLMEDTTSSSIQEASKKIARTPARIAIALLLQHPEIYPSCAEALSNLKDDLDGQHIVKALLEQITENPTINTAQLVELWRDSPLFESLNKLAVWEHQVPEHAALNEFIDVIRFLSKQSHEHKIQQLMEKANTKGLTEEDRHTLQSLLKQRHRVNNVQ